MSFDEFDEYQNFYCNDNEEQLDECEHPSSVITDGGKRVCSNCGCEILVIDHEAEWKYGGGNGGTHVARCSKYRNAERGSNIRNVFEDKRIDDRLVNENLRLKCEEKFRRVVGKENVHGVKRVAIVAACLYHVFNEDGQIRSSSEVGGYFGLTKKDVSLGLTEYRKKFPESRVTKIGVEDFIRRDSERLKLNHDIIPKIIEMWHVLEKTHAEVIRSTPTILSPSLIYIYISEHEAQYKESIKLTLETIAQTLNVSKVTLSKHIKIITKILNVEAGAG